MKMNLTDEGLSFSKGKFTVEKEKEDGKGFFYKVKNKLKKLNNAIIEYNVNEDGWQDLGPVESVEHTKEQYEVYQLLEKLINDGKISKSDMRRCNALWRKYK